MIRSRTSASAKRLCVSASAQRPSHMCARAVVLQIVKRDRHPDPRIAATCLSLLIAHIFAQQRKALCSSHYTSPPSLSLSRSDSVSPYISLLLSSLVQVPLVPVTCRRRDALFGNRSRAVIEWREEVGCSRGHMDGGDEGLQASGRPSKTNLPPYTAVRNRQLFIDKHQTRAECGTQVPNQGAIRVRGHVTFP